jgi:hypothetical protein
MIVADAHRRRGVAKVEDLDPTSSRAVAEYFSVLDDAAFGGTSISEFVNEIDPLLPFKIGPMNGWKAAESGPLDLSSGRARSGRSLIAR